MNYYIEIKLLNDSQINLGFLWQKVFTQIHIALAHTKKNIGISFVEYDNKAFPLGNKLRLFANYENNLDKLDIQKWLKRLTDYVQISSIKKTPNNFEYVIFSRKQFKTGIQRLAKRYAKRHNIGYEEARKYYENMDEQQSKLPYINIKSNSTNQMIKIFIKKQNKSNLVNGTFNSYGLSNDATIPWF